MIIYRSTAGKVQKVMKKSLRRLLKAFGKRVIDFRYLSEVFQALRVASLFFETFEYLLFEQACLIDLGDFTDTCALKHGK